MLVAEIVYEDVEKSPGGERVDKYPCEKKAQLGQNIKQKHIPR